MASRGHFYAVGSDRSTPGWPYRSKTVAQAVATVRNATSRQEFRVYRHDR